MLNNLCFCSAVDLATAPATCFFYCWLVGIAVAFALVLTILLSRKWQDHRRCKKDVKELCSCCSLRKAETVAVWGNNQRVCKQCNEDWDRY